MTRLLVLLLLCSTAAPAAAQTAVIPTQAQNSVNQEAISAAGAPVSVTLIAAPHVRVHLYSLAVRCSAGSAAVTVTDGGVQRWSSDGGFAVPLESSAAWIPPFTGGLGKTVVVTLGSCGGSEIGTLAIQGDIF